MDADENRASDLDEKDLELLAYVEADFDVSLNKIAEKLDLSKSAIHYRINKLKEEGVIEGVTADVDPLALGLNMSMITEVMVMHEPGYAEDIGTQLCDIDGVEQVYYTMGDVDFVLVSRVQNRHQMNTLIDEVVSIDGVNETSSSFVMQELKTDGNVVANISTEMYDNVLEES